MKKIILISTITLLSACSQQQAHPPVGGILSEKDLNISKNRAKSLNEMERAQIQDWINQQDEKFYPMKLNYWVNQPDLNQKNKKQDGETVSYQYDIFDFDQVKLSENTKIVKNLQLAKFEELKAVEDALRYMEKNQEITLLIPSVLAFGTYGDNKNIPNDMPLIIKLKTE